MPTWAESRAAGKAERRTVPLEAHAEFTPNPDREPTGWLLGQSATRVPELVPVRHGRMLASEFAFFRGAALVMANDLRETPTTGLTTQLCGDAHLSNFGAYASAERRLIFDINDFDETFPGPFEWDVKRLATSVAIGSQTNGYDGHDTRRCVEAAVKTYRRAMRGFANQTIREVWYASFDVDQYWSRYLESLSPKQKKRHRVLLRRQEKSIAKARTRTSLQAIGKLTERVDGTRRLVSDRR